MDRSDPLFHASVEPTTGKPPTTKPAFEGARSHAPAGGEGPVALAVTTEEEGVHPDQASFAASPKERLSTLAAAWSWDELKPYCVRGTKVVAIVFSAWFTVVLFLIVVYRFVNPPFSSLMVLQWLGGTSIRQEWVPLERISPHLMRAVIASEDGRFCSHWGIDYAEVADAIRHSSGGIPRGASTITMQVAKNLFLWPAKSYVRKLIEVPLTYAIELFWSKQRILEVYLNIAEWGPGIFGAEAAAEADFGRSADRLSSRQGALLAVALPNPFTRDAGDPGPWASQRATVIQRRAARSPEEATCVLGGD
jgi:monofunctional biosynthetic peptidoglycan transglycosylase